MGRARGRWDRVGAFITLEVVGAPTSGRWHEHVSVRNRDGTPLVGGGGGGARSDADVMCVGVLGRCVGACGPAFGRRVRALSQGPTHTTHSARFSLFFDVLCARPVLTRLPMLTRLKAC